MSFKDRTYCASPNCENKCGRKMSIKERDELNELNKVRLFYPCEVSYGYFCGEPGELYAQMKSMSEEEFKEMYSQNPEATE